MDEDVSRKICQLVAGIVVADDDLDPAESDFIDRMLDKFGIPRSQREVIFPIIDAAEAVEKVRALAPAVQQEILTLLIEAATADGKITAEERAYLDAVANAIGTTPETLAARLAIRLD
ncbi:MAG: TerB family tellurite resistance protein [Deltaproteobacteria bacterium]|nr:TerB family tellurite resistance protein [Deltaproteobacteria bacterium]